MGKDHNLNIMNINEKSANVYKSLKKEMISAKSRIIPLEKLLSNMESINADMPVYLQSPEGQAVFAAAVDRLISEQVLSPVGKKPVTRNGLHLRYRILQDTEKADAGLADRIIKTVRPPATVDYYIGHPQDFLSDCGIIEIICGFAERYAALKRECNGRRQDKEKRTHEFEALPKTEAGGHDILTVNERAYELFGDEKFFRGDEKSRSRGEAVLKRLGLTYSDLGCTETVEPFFSFQRRDFHSKDSRVIHIIENKDTFWSFKKNVMDRPSSINADMLVYGEGRKILSSFRFAEEHGIDKSADVFMYFGDLDAEGINIYCELADAYPEYRIIPFTEGYRSVMDIGLRRLHVKAPRRQRIVAENIVRFCGILRQSMTPADRQEMPDKLNKLEKLMLEGFYIPQEALSAAEMEKRFRTAGI